MSFQEWSKVDGFLEEFKGNEDTFVCQVDNVTMVAVFDGECAMAYFKEVLAKTFEDEPVVVELR